MAVYTPRQKETVQVKGKAQVVISAHVGRGGGAVFYVSCVPQYVGSVHCNVMQPALSEVQAGITLISEMMRGLEVSQSIGKT